MATRDEYGREVDARMDEDERRDRVRITSAQGLIDEARANIVRRLESAGEFETVYLEGLRREIEDVLGDMDQGVSGLIGVSGDEISDQVDTDLTDTLRIASIATDFPMIDRALITSYVEFASTTFKGVTTEASAKIMQEVALSAVGAKTRNEAIGEIGRNLSDRSIFRTISQRAETILSTEQARLRAAARQHRMDALSERDLGLMKYWQTRGDTNVRSTHVQAGLDYSEERAIALDARYRIGGFWTLYPRAWSLPAKESVRCRCYSLIYVPDDLFSDT
ncbi:MAG: hypothetical protein F4Y39_24775 [Gemmatimonadetes bacterium]|nr:hypothetical protein [Gemmatimonadota bacterium]MYF79163.1 hypothetical protein [Chloroflexota bacterium]